MSTVPSPPDTTQTARRRGLRGCVLPATMLVLLLSVLVNLVFVLGYAGVISDPLSDAPNGVEEHLYLGDARARDKIAIVRVSGVISESGIAFPVRQLRAAAADRRVKAVVLRIDSPGGTVSASEELYQCVVNVRDNTGRRFAGTAPKPVSVSMGALAASGGYYIAVAGHPIVAERVTITGSIGVFAALPNVAELAHNTGVKLELVKAGGIKASGSFFHKLTPEERQTWQDTVDNAYDTFLDVISKGRPELSTDALRNTVVLERTVPRRDEKGNPEPGEAQKPTVKYTRIRADGGTFTAPQAYQFKLIDGIEDLPSAVRSAAARNGLPNFKAVIYEKPSGLVEKVTGLPLGRQGNPLNWPDVSGALTPRLWYLSPSADAGLLAPVP
ncbi:S49 family peptidase [Frigoriglobus tundricola]|uniref:Protease IV n=1 Tax=Frigoriglobus tundricola TaxID=2774151 RepID=A0A6M5Z543_9BACT|nr:S49 family peptidase [Frigoriglobus tundricola]QJX00581.1 Protease IV [Frigoriglobus tundricola]